jgi:hypothetical protein
MKNTHSLKKKICKIQDLTPACLKAKELHFSLRKDLLEAIFLVRLYSVS